MKCLLTTAFIVVTKLIAAQKGIEAMIQAEKNFAAFAVTHNTKDAFLAFMNDSAIMFSNGAAVNGKKLWLQREKRPGILNWGPQWVEMSFSQTFGFSSGPWVFMPRTINDSIIARGYFATVWQLDSDGSWKFLIDIGVEGAPLMEHGNIKKWDHPTTNHKKLAAVKLSETENNFINEWKKNPSKAYSLHLSHQSVMLRNGQAAADNEASRNALIDATPDSIELKNMDTVTASSNDMGYSYGTVTYKGKTDNYLRIWRRENDGWKIALEVLRF